MHPPDVSHPSPAHGSAAAIFRHPQPTDGAALWTIARDTNTLDLNSSYAYLLWCRDFADTTVVCEVDGAVVGFATGYLRPAAPGALFVWQVGVDSAHRGQRLALGMLRWLHRRAAPLGASRIETTISPDNTASQALFQALARTLGTDITHQPLFHPADFPTGGSHQPEDLYTVGNRRL